ncbi:MAG: O-antigen ligase family protein [Vicinamibacterales bacterium]
MSAPSNMNPVNQLKRLPLIAGALVAAVAAGFVLSFEQFALLTAVSVVALGGLLLMAEQINRPVTGLTVLLIVAVVAPMEAGVGQSTVALSPFVATALSGIYAVRVLFLRGTLNARLSRTVPAVLTLMAIAALSFVIGQYPWFPTTPAPIRAQLGGLAMFLVSGGVFLLTAHQLTAPDQLKRLTWLFVALGVVAIGNSVAVATDIKVGPISLTNSETIGAMFWVWFVAVTLSQSLFNRELSMLWRVLLALCTALALVRGVGLAFSWVSGWLPPLVAAGVIVTMRFPRTAIATALLLVAPVLFIGEPALEALSQGESYSIMTRLEALRVLGRIMESNPWLGYGPSNYYHYTLLFPILGWYVNFNSHNNYIDLILQVGLIGLLAFLWCVAESLWLAFRLRARASNGFADGYAVGVIAGLVASLVAAALADWIIPFTYNVGLRGFRSSVLFWFFTGGALALYRLSARPSAAVDYRGPIDVPA